MSESTPISEIFKSRLKHARETRGMNQGELAKKAQLQPSAISHFESGTRKPSFENLRKIATALDVTTDYLLGRSEKPDSHASTSQTLFRDYEKLSSGDRKLAEDFIQFLATKKPENKE